MWCVVAEQSGEFSAYGPYDTEAEAETKLEELEADLESSEDDDDDVEADDIDYHVVKLEK